SFNALVPEDNVPIPDVLIVGRGGGSLEDLMPFNEEDVVRAIAASRIPVISAVGHETDISLSDYAADRRAPTPTAAAEMAVPVRAELIAQVAQIDGRLSVAAARGLAERQEKLRLFARAMGDPMRALEPLMQRLDERAERLSLAWKSVAQGKAHHFEQLATRIKHPRDGLALAAQRLENESARLEATIKQKMLHTEKQVTHVCSLLAALSPRAVLGRGYGLVYDEQGRLMTHVADMKAGALIKVELQDGSRSARVAHSRRPFEQRT
ncbi:MAG: exodeoxyribonuclease VII large subunit, partial [Bdellovibrionales bacterium]